jgi:hypothetical protein
MRRSRAAFLAAVALVSGCTSNPAPTAPAPTTAAPALSEPQAATSVAPAPPAAPLPVEEGRWAIDGSLSFLVCFGYTTQKQERDHEGDFVDVAGSLQAWVMMSVKNVGFSQQTYLADSQRLQDSDGRLFSADLEALTREGARADINPGLSAQVMAAFDVPAGTDISQYVIVLHGSPNSVGVPARLPNSNVCR